MAQGETKYPLSIDEFKSEIDNRSGFFQEEAVSIDDFEDDLQSAIDEESEFELTRERVLYLKSVPIKQFQQSIAPFQPAVDKSRWVLPEDTEEWKSAHPYVERNEGRGLRLDEEIPLIIDWLKNPNLAPPEGTTKTQWTRFKIRAGRFFLSNDGKLYRRNEQDDGPPRLYVPKDRRMYMLHSAHDFLGHKGVFATKELISRRFWWPDLDSDVSWFVQTCIPCQQRQLRHVKLPPTVTFTPSLFQKIHVDTFKMSPASNGCTNVVHGRCALSSWSEARALRQENARTLGEWFFDDIICQ